MNEQRLWKGSPSQILNWYVFAVNGFITLAIFWLLIWVDRPYYWLCLPSVVYTGWKYLELKCREYELTSQRLITRRGVLSRNTDEMELYQIRDYRLREPFYLRLFGLSNIELSTDDRSDPLLTIPAVPNGKQLIRLLRDHVEQARQRTPYRY